MPQQTLFRGATRTVPVPPCSLDRRDLVRLFKLLKSKADDAAEIEARSLKSILSGTDSPPAEDPGPALEDLRRRMELVVRVEDENGDWLGGPSADALSDENLPERIRQVEFHSAFGLQNMQYKAQNWFRVVLDFGRVSVLDLTTQPDQQTPNESIVLVSGSDSTVQTGDIGNRLDRGHG